MSDRTPSLSDWQGRTLNALYPLKRYLGGSANSAVYLTQFAAPDGLANAAIKLRAADPESAERLLGNWRIASGLEHPHLLRVIDFGRSTSAGIDIVYIVTEYAEENLAEILPIRALEPGEVREMLRPTLSALAYLHARELVQGSLKPANFLVVADQLKLATDTVRPAGRASDGPMSRYDPPEAPGGPMSTAADLWALGITLLEALTQGPAASPPDSGRRLRAANVPDDLIRQIERCLSSVPQSRPTATELQRWIEPDFPEQASPASATSPRPSPITAPATERQGTQSKAVLMGLGLVALLLIFGLGSYVLRSRHTTPASEPTPASATPPAASDARGISPVEATPPATAAPTRPGTGAPVAAVDTPLAPGTRPPTIGHRQMPVVARSALATVHGRLKVVVWIRIDGHGRVTEARLRRPGPSRYFAQAALAAAQGWRFEEANSAGRGCLLNFVFTNHGVSAETSCDPQD